MFSHLAEYLILLPRQTEEQPLLKGSLIFILKAFYDLEVKDLYHPSNPPSQGLPCTFYSVNALAHMKYL